MPGQGSIALTPFAVRARVENGRARGAIAAFGPPGSPSVVRAAADQYIEQHLTDTNLAPRAVAQGIGVSLRTLHRAYEHSSESVAGLIRARRLARARDELQAGRTITQVVERWSFADASHFSRLFKPASGSAHET